MNDEKSKIKLTMKVIASNIIYYVCYFVFVICLLLYYVWLFASYINNPFGLGFDFFLILPFILTYSMTYIVKVIVQL